MPNPWPQILVLNGDPEHQKFVRENLGEDQPQFFVPLTGSGLAETIRAQKPQVIVVAGGSYYQICGLLNLISKVDSPERVLVVTNLTEDFADDQSPIQMRKRYPWVRFFNTGGAIPDQHSGEWGKAVDLKLRVRAALAQVVIIDFDPNQPTALLAKSRLDPETLSYILRRFHYEIEPALRMKSLKVVILAGEQAEIVQSVFAACQRICRQHGLAIPFVIFTIKPQPIRQLMAEEAFANIIFFDASKDGPAPTFRSADELLETIKKFIS